MTLRGTCAAYAAVLLAASCSVDSKDGYTFGSRGGQAGTTGGNTASGGARTAGGRAGLGGAGPITEGGAAGASMAGAFGGSGIDGGAAGSGAGNGSQGGLSSSGGDGSGRGGTAGAAGAVGAAGAGGSDIGECSENSCPGGFACAGGACNTSCVSDPDCAAGFFCEAFSCHLRVLDVRLGSAHTCALMSDGTVRCWGTNRDRQLGSATTTPRSARPVAVHGVSRAVGLAAGSQHSCALLEGGSVVCWGSNSQGALGNPSLAEGGSSAEPVVVALPSAAASISASCAVLKTGAVWCWGTNIYSELADSTLGSFSAKPAPISGLSGVTQVSAGPCAIANGSLYCWGNNGDAQCGSGSEPSTVATPTLVNAVTSPTSVSAGFSHGCALVNDGAARCWGSNSEGQLGTGSAGDRSWSAVPVQGLPSSVAAISTGAFHTCAALASGAAFCWGRGGGGELGTGTLLSVAAPTPVSGISGVVVIRAGFQHSCAVKKDGTLWCWGYGTEGEIGTLWTNSASPVQVTF